MGSVLDKAKSVWRAFVTDGVPASGPNDPVKADIISLFQLIDQLLGGAISGATPVDTAAHLPAPTGTNKLYVVTSDPTVANNGYWQDQGTSNVQLTQLNAFLKGATGANGTLAAASNAQLTAGTDNTTSVTPAGLSFLGLTAAFIASLKAMGTVLVNGYEQSGYRYAVIGSDGNLLFGVTDDAVPQFVSGGGFVSTSTPNTLKEMLNSVLVSYTGGLGYQQSGRALSFTGTDGNEIGGIGDESFPQPTGAFSPFKNDRGAYIFGMNWDVEAYRDANNNMQVFSIDKASGNVARQLSAVGHDHISVRLNETAGLATWVTSAADRWPSKQMRWRPLNASKPAAPVFAKAGSLVTWGDSIGQGNVADTGMGFVALTAAATGLASLNQSGGGMQSWQQAMQMGARPTYVTTAGASIGTSAVAITALGTTPTNGKPITTGLNIYPNYMLLTSASAATKNLFGWIVDANGVRQRALMTRSVVSSAETYTITSQAGVPIAVTSTFRFIPDVGDLLSFPTIIEPGINDLSQGLFRDASDGGAVPVATILADLRATQDLMVAALGPLCPCFVITGLFNPRASWAAAGTDVDTAIIAHNNDRRTKYGWQFCDIFAIFAAGGDGSANDNADIAQHWPPRSLVDPTSSNAGTGQSGSTNTVHPNNAGHADIANGNAGGRGVIAILQPQLAALPAT